MLRGNPAFLESQQLGLVAKLQGRSTVGMLQKNFRTTQTEKSMETAVGLSGSEVSILSELFFAYGGARLPQSAFSADPGSLWRAWDPLEAALDSFLISSRCLRGEVALIRKITKTWDS